MQDTIITHQDLVKDNVKRRRRTYSKAFKAEIVAQCQQGDKSIAQVAREQQINAILIHKWCRPPNPQPMLPVTVSPTASGRDDSIASHVEVLLGDRTLRFYGAIDKDSVRAIVEALS